MKKDIGSSWTIAWLLDELKHYVIATESAIVSPQQSYSQNKRKVQINTHGKFEPKGGHRRKGNSTSKPGYGFATSNRSKVDKSVSTRFSADQCRYCTEKHYSDECWKFKTDIERKKQIKGSCFRCLREGHFAKECKKNKTCVHCGEENKHHRSLCPKMFGTKTLPESSNMTFNEKNDKIAEETTENSLVSSNDMVLMQTALVEIQNPKNAFSLKTRLLLDCGSQRTYITESLANRLGLKKESEQEIKLSTFGSDKPKVIKTASTTLSLKLNNGQYFKVTANIVPVISGSIIRKHIDMSSLGHLEHLLKSVDMADTIPTETESSSVEILIGNDYYLDLVLPQRLELQPGLYLLSSKFGWILTGRTSEVTETMNENNFLILSHGTNLTKNETLFGVDNVVQTKPDLEDFWNIETIGITDSSLRDEDDIVMEKFKNTLIYQDGRYYVTWPWRKDFTELPNNRQLALGRLKSCLKRLKGNPELMEEYNTVIEKQLQDGVIEKVPQSTSSEMKHYIPHHPLITPHKKNHQTSNCIRCFVKTY